MSCMPKCFATIVGQGNRYIHPAWIHGRCITSSPMSLSAMDTGGSIMCQSAPFLYCSMSTLLFIRPPWCSYVHLAVHTSTLVFIRPPWCSYVHLAVHTSTLVFIHQTLQLFIDHFLANIHTLYLLLYFHTFLVCNHSFQTPSPIDLTIIRRPLPC